MLEYIVRKVASEIPCELLILDAEKRPSAQVRLLIPVSATTLASTLLQEVLDNKTTDTPQEGIAVFETLTDEEMLTFAKFKDLKYEENVPSEIDRVIKMIDEKYENGTFGLVKSKKVLDSVSTSQSRDNRQQ